MKKILLILFLLSFGLTKAQVDFSAGMGLSYFAASSFRDYINANFAYNNQLSSFQSSVIFLTEADYTVERNFQLGLEYAFNIYSYNNGLSLGYYNVSMNLHKPSIVAYYLITGEGYKFKFGGGIGPRFVLLEEKLPNYADSRKYDSPTGVGAVLKAVGLTTLGGNLYALIEVEMRYDYNGEPTFQGKKFFDNINQANVNLNLISVGLILGVAYSF
jgi:hypothetical protein